MSADQDIESMKGTLGKIGNRLTALEVRHETLDEQGREANGHLDRVADRLAAVETTMPVLTERFRGEMKLMLDRMSELSTQLTETTKVASSAASSVKSIENKGRGALWAFSAVAAMCGFLGATFGWLAAIFTGHHT